MVVCPEGQPLMTQGAVSAPVILQVRRCLLRRHTSCCTKVTHWTHCVHLRIAVSAPCIEPEGAHEGRPIDSGCPVLIMRS